jgi:hypothetical protein
MLFAILVAIGVGAGLLTWDAQRRIADLHRAGQDLDARIDSMLSMVGRIGLAQQAYVAPGQPHRLWLEQVASLVQQLSDETGAVRPHTRAPAAAGTLQAIHERIARLVDVDSRARVYTSVGQDLLAADLIFSEGRNTLDGIAADLRAVRAAEETEGESRRATLTTQSGLVLGGATMLWVLGLALLVRVPRPREPATETLASASRAPAPVAEAQPDATPRPPLEPAAAAVDLNASADLCTAMSRATKASDLPPLLARAASILDASGLIVWMSAGEELFAVTAHGYDPRVVERLGPIARDAKNATAACWRTGDTLAVAGGDEANGAIVAPMFGPGACIGVLAVEVRNRREQEPAARAVATMIAAQLAAIVSAWPPASAASRASATGS